MTALFDGMPRMYRTTRAERAVMPAEQLDALWDEYLAYWAGYENHSNKLARIDQDDDEPGLVEWGIASARIGD